MKMRQRNNQGHIGKQKPLFGRSGTVRTRSVVVVAVLVAVQAVAGVAGQVPVAQAAGSLGGSVFRDYNANGRKDTTTAQPAALDVGLAGVVVTVFGSSGAVVGTATSAGDGTWQVTPSAAGPYRVEFSALPAGYQPTSAGATGAATTVQFVPDTGSAEVNLGLNRPSEYCQDNPDLVTNCYAYGGQAGVTDPVLVSFPTSAGAPVPSSGGAAYDDPKTHSLMVPAAAVGTTWGLAYSGAAKTLFAGAFMKKHSGFGPAGTGAIYKVDRSGPTPVTTVHADLNALFGAGTAGTDPHDPADYDRDNGNATWEAVGKVSLGGMAVSDDASTLFAMNLADRRLYAMPADATPTAATTRSTSVPLDPPGCPSASDVRPFAVSYHDGKVYVGLVCSAESSQDAADLKAYIYEVNPATFTFSPSPVFTVSLQYPRDPVTGGVPPPVDWVPWRNTYSSIAPDLPDALVYPQPILSKITFDGGDLVLGIRDRSGDESGNGTLDDPSTSNRTLGLAQGELLRACSSGGAGWEIETNGSCGGIGTGGVGNGGGIGGGEYYYQDNYLTYHPETNLGVGLQIPGYPSVVSTTFDPIPSGDEFFDTGVRWYENSSGETVRAYRVIDGDRMDLISAGKGNGFGDLTVLCDAAPIEIGNRLWVDADGDGVQDPDETALAGVLVELWKAGVKVGTAVTGADGTYRFTSALTTDPDTSDNLGGGVTANGSFEIRVPDATGTSAQAPLNGFTLTSANIGGPAADGRDSDATLAGTTAVIPVTTGPAGFNNHTYDIGFKVQPVSIGNQVWLDTDNDGIKQVGEVTRPGVRVELFLDADSDGQLTGAEQTPIATDTTDANGLYLFTEYTTPGGAPLPTPKPLTAGKYVVGVAPSAFAAGGPLAGYHSSGSAISSDGALTDGIANTGPVDGDDNGREQTSGFYAGGVLSAIIDLKAGRTPTGEDPDNNDPTIPDTSSDLTIDFGFYTASLGNQVWVDDLAADPDNGVKDAGEDGFGGVPVTLLAADGITVVATTTTDSNGRYTFDGLAAGNYRVKISAPAGYVSSTDLPSTADPNSNTDSDDNGVGAGSGAVLSGPVTISPGSTGAASNNVVTAATGSTADPTVDFGLVPTVSVGDFVWWDRDKDGLQDPDEPGVPGATATLYAADGTTAVTRDALGRPVVPVTTDGTGNYSFDSLRPGKYVVKFTAPPGWLPSPVRVGSDPAVDSDGATATSADLTAGRRDDTLDSGFYPLPPAVGDFVWQDRDGDGVQDPGEPGLAGATVRLFQADGTTPVTTDADGNPIGPVTTTAGGAYLFANLDPGSYVVKITPPAGWSPTVTGAGTSSTDSNGASIPVTLVADQVDLTRDSGFVLPTVSVGDFVWFDADHDGVQGSGEHGLAGATATLYEADGTTPVRLNAFGDPVTAQVTGADGKYLFADLSPGKYVVKFTAPPGGYLPTVTGAGTTATDSDGTTATSATLAGGEEDLTLDSGFWLPPVSVGDFVWFDADHDGVQEPDEQGLPGATATLYAADGVTRITTDALGWPVTPQVTAADGKYLFADLPPGKYVVQFTAPTGYLPTRVAAGTPGTDSNGPTATSALLPAGQEDLTLDAGFWLPAGLGDKVWLDQDIDGVQDPGEPGVAGVTVELLDATGEVVATTRTDKDGTYRFTGLTAGTYSVRFRPPPGLVLTGGDLGGDDAKDSDADVGTGRTTTVTLAPGENNPTLDAGVIAAASVSGLVFVDSDGDGRPDPGERRLAGITITLTGLDVFGNTVTRTVTTGPDGSYSFGNLRPGRYTLTERRPGGDHVLNFSLRSGQQLTGRNFPERPTTAPGVPPGSPIPSFPLAHTGFSGFGPLVAGLLLLASGAGMRIAGRRRRVGVGVGDPADGER
jgi:hypothetical protein